MTPPSWVAYAARALEREQRRDPAHLGYWYADRVLKPDEWATHRDRLVDGGLHDQTLDGIRYTWVPA